jgi:hypothetical protein
MRGARDHKFLGEELLTVAGGGDDLEERPAGIRERDLDSRADVDVDRGGGSIDHPVVAAKLRGHVPAVAEPRLASRVVVTRSVGEVIVANA